MNKTALALITLVLILGCTSDNTSSNCSCDLSSSTNSSSSSSNTCMWNLLSEFDQEYYVNVKIDNDSVYSFKYVLFSDSLHIGYSNVYAVDSNFRYRNEKVYDISVVNCNNDDYIVSTEEASVVDLKEYFYITKVWKDSYRNSSWAYGDSVFIKKVDIGKIIVRSRDSLTADWNIDTLLRY